MEYFDQAHLTRSLDDFNTREIEEYMPDNRPHWADRFIAIFTGLMLITYITANYFSCQQLKLTKKTFEEVQKGSTDTQKLVEATGKQADAAKRFANSAEGINTQTKLAVDKFDRMARAAESNAAQSKRSLDAAIEQSHSDQRAWVALSPSAPLVDFNKPPTASFTVVNSGKTPARKVIIRVWLNFFPQMLSILPTGIEPTETSVGVIFPGGRGESNIVPYINAPISLTNLGIDGTWYAYAWGHVEYLDVFGKPHNTQICGYRKISEAGDFLQCNFGNDAN